MDSLDVIQEECPPDVVDRLLWRNARAILHRHSVALDGTCRWCGRNSPCSARRLAERADKVARLPWHEALAARNDITRLLPVLAAELPNGRVARGRNQRTFA